MGEEANNPEEKKTEEGKKAEAEAEAQKAKPEDKKKAADEAKKEGGDDGKAESAPPPPPEEILLRVYMHCEGCARKVKRCLKGFDGVEEVTTDCRTHMVVVKGKKAAEDPLKVAERVQKKSGRKVELLTPLPPPKPEKKEEEKEEKPKPPEINEPPVISVVLKVHMHCEACSQEIKKRILKMKGVQAAEPDLKASEVTVKGVMEASKLVEYVYKRTGKHSVIVKTEPAEKKPEEAPSEAEEKGKASEAEGGGEEKKAADSASEEKKKTEGEKKWQTGGEEGREDKERKEDGTAAGGKLLDLKKNELYYYYPRYVTEYQSYAPQLFSDENPNACSVM